MKKGYKVVSVKSVKDKLKYYSSYAYGKARVQYFFDRFVEAPKWLAKKGFELTCFSDKKLAIKYMTEFWVVHPTNNFFKLIEIEYEPAETERPICCNMYELARGKIIEALPCIVSFPGGTIFAKRIKLVRCDPFETVPLYRRTFDMLGHQKSCTSLNGYSKCDALQLSKNRNDEWEYICLLYDKKLSKVFTTDEIQPYIRVCKECEQMVEFRIKEK